MKAAGRSILKNAEINSLQCRRAGFGASAIVIYALDKIRTLEYNWYITILR